MSNILDQDDWNFLELSLETLDKDWIDQPKLMGETCRYRAKKHKALRSVKNRLKLHKAKLGKRVRADPSKFGMKGVTEKALEEVICLDAKTIELQDKLDTLEYVVEELDAAIAGLKDRKAALESLVYLFGQAYFAKPSQKGA